MRGDQAERISISPDELWFPPDLYEQAFEIISSMGKVDTANNNVNVHEGRYTFYEWNYLTSTKNWFMCDSKMRKQYAFWSDRVPLEFAMAEDLDTLLAKWRAYMRYGQRDHRLALDHRRERDLMIRSAKQRRFLEATEAARGYTGAATVPCGDPAPAPLTMPGGAVQSGGYLDHEVQAAVDAAAEGARMTALFEERSSYAPRPIRLQ
jgi:phage anti-repressor protein